MSAHMNPDAAREQARQDNGQFGTQPLAEVDVVLTNDQEASILSDDEDGAGAYMAFQERTMGTPPEPDTFSCAECGEYLIADPDGSEGVLVHIDEDGDRDYDADEDHTGIDEDQVEAIGANVAYPNGRCQSCGFGLDAGGLCYQIDCSRFDVNSAHAEDGHTTSGDEAEWVTAAELSVGDRLIEGTITSIDNDHKSTSIELDGDPETIAEYANDERVARYVADDKDDELRECDDDCVEHASWCDGYCNHSDGHRNACLDLPAAEQPLSPLGRDSRPHPDLADSDVDKAFGA